VFAAGNLFMAQPTVSTTSMFHIDYVPEPDSPRTRILKGSRRAEIEAAGTLLDWQRRNIDDSKMEEISDALIQQVSVVFFVFIVVFVWLVLLVRFMVSGQSVFECDRPSA
jgi:hypothetical protein